MQKAETELASVCEELSELRKVYGKQLEDRIIHGLQDLNFLDVKFEIDFETTEHYTENGNDKICFTISTNPGEPLRPLAKVYPAVSFPVLCWQSRRFLRIRMRRRH